MAGHGTLAVCGDVLTGGKAAEVSTDGPALDYGSMDAAEPELRPALRARGEVQSAWAATRPRRLLGYQMLGYDPRRQFGRGFEASVYATSLSAWMLLDFDMKFRSYLQINIVQPAPPSARPHSRTCVGVIRQFCPPRPA